MQLYSKIEKINELFAKIASKKVAVWGAGIHTSKLMTYTDLINLNICFLVDKKEAKYTKYLYGKPVVLPDEANFGTVDFIVVSSYKFQTEIVNEIVERGFAEKIVCLYDEDDEGEFYHLINRNTFYFSGNYKSWQEAERESIGYSDQSIIEKVLESTMLVIEGKACYERDSVTFHYPDYNFKLLAIVGLLFSKKSEINILDFGGALGSEYWKNRNMLYQYNKKFTWNVVEQSNYVCIGNEKVKNDELAFYNNIDELKEPIQVALLSGVLQYIEDYRTILKAVISKQPEYIMIDRQVVMDDESRICVQYVTEEIYKASYPVRIISEKELLSTLDSEYELIISNYSSVESGIYYVDEKEFRYKDFLFRRKNN